MRWLLAVLLLLAQHGALTHALVHVGAQAHGTALHTAHGQDADDDHGTPGKSAVSGQCAFDLVYSQVLGALHSAVQPQCTATQAVAVVFAGQAVAAATVEVPYDSRGPPALS